MYLIIQFSNVIFDFQWRNHNKIDFKLQKEYAGKMVLIIKQNKKWNLSDLEVTKNCEIDIKCNGNHANWRDREKNSILNENTKEKLNKILTQTKLEEKAEYNQSKQKTRDNNTFFLNKTKIWWNSCYMWHIKNAQITKLFYETISILIETIGVY